MNTFKNFTLSCCLFFIGLNASLACSCFPTAEEFCETIIADSSIDLVVKAVKTADIYYGMEIEITEVLMGVESQSAITVWGDNGALCRVFTDEFEIGEVIYLALHKTDFAGNLIPNFNYPLDLEQNGDYILSVCGKYYEEDSVDGSSTALTIANNCPFTMTTDVETSTIGQLEIFPNPVTDRLNIKTDNPLETVQMFSATGKLIKEQEITGSTTMLDLSNLNNGVYFIVLNDGNAEEVRKVVVQK